MLFYLEYIPTISQPVCFAFMWGIKSKKLSSL